MLQQCGGFLTRLRDSALPGRSAGDASKSPWRRRTCSRRLVGLGEVTARRQSSWSSRGQCSKARLNTRLGLLRTILEGLRDVGRGRDQRASSNLRLGTARRAPPGAHVRGRDRSPVGMQQDERDSLREWLAHCRQRGPDMRSSRESGHKRHDRRPASAGSTPPAPGAAIIPLSPMAISRRAGAQSRGRPRSPSVTACIEGATSGATGEANPSRSQDELY